MHEAAWTNSLQFTGPSPNITGLTLAAQNLKLLLQQDENLSHLSCHALWQPFTRAWALHTHPGKKRGWERKINEELPVQEEHKDQNIERISDLPQSPIIKTVPFLTPGKCPEDKISFPSRVILSHEANASFGKKKQAALFLLICWMDVSLFFKTNSYFNRKCHC